MPVKANANAQPAKPKVMRNQRGKERLFGLLGEVLGELDEDMERRRLNKRPLNYNGAQHCCTTLKLRGNYSPRGVLATLLQIPHSKLLYIKGGLLLRFNVTLDMFHLNAGF